MHRTYLTNFLLAPALTVRGWLGVGVDAGEPARQVFGTSIPMVLAKVEPPTHKFVCPVCWGNQANAKFRTLSGLTEHLEGHLSSDPPGDIPSDIADDPFSNRLHNSPSNAPDNSPSRLHLRKVLDYLQCVILVNDTTADSWPDNAQLGYDG
ncbi:hypothetical protein FE257_002323 [Aspergillus nanangensis]|uniref:BED-type domain-containing protein n=1 Tax=Aspergillus nanangensis TaxID=2582783 RepID=A0AAD4CD53_ASPNN|nr:hypothetical protein FE257_002323 [Aspergillus nanangensis]